MSKSPAIDVRANKRKAAFKFTKGDLVPFFLVSVLANAEVTQLTAPSAMADLAHPVTERAQIISTDALRAPGQSILAMGETARGIMDASETLKRESGDLAALSWSYTFLPKQVDAYYDQLGQTVKQTCSGVLQKCSSEYQTYAYDLYGGFQAQVPFRNWDRVHREIFLTQATSDPLLIKARANWDISDPSTAGYMDMNQRMLAAQRVSALYLQAFAGNGLEFQTLKIGVVDADVPWNGQYLTGRNQYFLHANYVATQTFDRVIGTAIHETRHHVQNQLGTMTRTQAGQVYLNIHGLNHEAKVFAFMDWPGAIEITSGADIGYQRSPIERDAFRHADDAYQVGMNTKDKAILFQNLRSDDAQAASERAAIRDYFGSPNTRVAGKPNAGLNFPNVPVGQGSAPVQGKNASAASPAITWNPAVS